MLTLKINALRLKKTFIPTEAAIKVADLSTDELKTLIRETVTQVLAEILDDLDDLDEGLLLRPEVEEQLLRSR